MIRLRIERHDTDESPVDGILWYENGVPVGRVIIEQTENMGKVIDPEWDPVEIYFTSESR